MNENEIMLALERCASMDAGHCIRCPLFGDPWCKKTLSKHSLALINQKNAENERLQKYNTDMAFKHYDDGMKELAERLKGKAHNYYPSIDSYCVSRKVVLIADIDNLLGEMRKDNGR